MIDCFTGTGLIILMTDQTASFKALCHVTIHLIKATGYHPIFRGWFLAKCKNCDSSFMLLFISYFVYLVWNKGKWTTSTTTKPEFDFHGIFRSSTVQLNDQHRRRRHRQSTVYLPRNGPMTLVSGVDTLRPRQNGHHFPDDIFKFIFLNENAWIPIKISLKFVPQGPINNIPALVQIMAWRRPGDKPLSEPMMVRLPTHICVSRPQWVKGRNTLLNYPHIQICLKMKTANYVSIKYGISRLHPIIFSWCRGNIVKIHLQKYSEI